MFDVAVYPHGAAMHHPAHPGGCRGFNDSADRCGIDRSVGRSRNACLSINRRDVVNHIDVPHGCADGRAVLERADGGLDSLSFERTGLSGLPDQCPHLIAARHQASSQVPAGKTRRAGD